jgi:peptidoglycan/xylan/chitin deacetylase (PgdA/CDA1 family)
VIRARFYAVSCMAIAVGAWLAPAFALVATAAADAPLASRTASLDAAPFRWPAGRRAAVSLSYDDAIDSQLDNAVPALDKAGIKATFYLTLSSESLRKRLPEWRALAAHGHELGNHTLFHPCSASAPGHAWVTPDKDLDHIRPDQWAAQVRVGNTMLQAIDGKTERSFTLPCGDFTASGEPVLPLVADDFVAIKAGDGGVVPDMWTLDPKHVGVTAPVGVTGAQLIALVEAAGAKGTMINFTFHGIGGDYLVVSNQAHGELLAYLAAHRDRYWTAPFIEIMRYVTQRQAEAAAARH